ncbi:unnamed protein product [Rotaria magnacalcarata]|uniref:Uncharacterized protein n=3 Tax=Rotaria magnacalcarata TaxID=392030 RepID=A0A816LB10_9BILA|nr:unnamed protein product [Rotaria magnacalcarata]CAF2040418.1 unnamed protein product [Rotaria magnacalcarata]CAF3967004.1 unnamed protein product [Rotaria magnacalcarata]CAF4054354.1 unnamed protein product [Rotaria magnacalcarata]
MDDLNEYSQEAQEDILPLRTFNSRRQTRQLRFSDETQQEQPESPSSFKPPSRATRFLSIYDAAIQFPTINLRKLRKLHSQAKAEDNISITEEITDELLDTIPFKIEIIPERQDDFTDDKNQLEKKRERHNKETMGVPKVIPSGLTDERRLEIIEEILKDLSQKDTFDEIRRMHAVPFELPKNNQMQKNVAETIRDLTGSDIVMLNDHIYMKNLRGFIQENYQKELEKSYKRLELQEKRRQ